MKKFGFTLTETLITLGIIGIVAAMVAPPLILSAGKSKIGPALYKAKNSFENAVSLMLEDKGVESLSFLGEERDVTDENGNITHDRSDAETVVRDMQNYLKSTYNEEKYNVSSGEDNAFDSDDYFRLDAEDNITYWIQFLSPINDAHPAGDYADIPTNQYSGIVFVDINGSGVPNTLAEDVFEFLVYNDGTLRPYGAEDFDRRISQNSPTWRNSGCDGTGINDRRTCTGSIFENEMKVIYSLQRR